MKQKTKNSFLAFLIFGVTFLLLNSCEKSADTNETTSNETVTDIDGNVYHTVTIGKQVWMVENLKTTKYRNGDPIPNVTDNTAWKNLINGACCNFDNKPENGATYGKLYNWYAVNDARKLAPAGWHVPTDDEQTILTDYLFKNGYIIGGGIAKSLASTSGWLSNPTMGNVGNDQAANNKSGFTGLPGGLRWDTGAFGFEYLGTTAFWWNSTAYAAPDNANLRSISCIAFSVTTLHYAMKTGASVRCLRD